LVDHLILATRQQHYLSVSDGPSPSYTHGLAPGKARVARPSASLARPSAAAANRRTARAGNRCFWYLSALRAHTKAPYDMDLYSKTLRALSRPRRPGQSQKNPRCSRDKPPTTAKLMYSFSSCQCTKKWSYATRSVRRAWAGCVQSEPVWRSATSKETNHAPCKAAIRLSNPGGVVLTVILVGSAGLGRPLAWVQLLRHLHQATERTLHLGLVRPLLLTKDEARATRARHHLVQLLDAARHPCPCSP
jgi:hypothetical protein